MFPTANTQSSANSQQPNEPQQGKERSRSLTAAATRSGLLLQGKPPVPARLAPSRAFGACRPRAAAVQASCSACGSQQSPRGATIPWYGSSAECKRRLVLGHVSDVTHPRQGSGCAGV